ncbi:hypothetical protein CALVIDRAFT_245167 [Calocera viscosa TUFC12733]|uniref:Uncharacterized protein n=1 Tax=Calocera viscosa (strain TUFC12733) TaxID=1330018 RepID=A0A167JHE2_CALVF|nr:hypothetical protein CALVIDRAFT_245167 [Calocera viscosa TUFC12733]
MAVWGSRTRGTGMQSGSEEMMPSSGRPPSGLWRPRRRPRSLQLYLQLPSSRYPSFISTPALLWLMKLLCATG